MQIAILGPLEVRDDDGQLLEVAGVRLRTLLTRLALDAGRPVGTGTLVDVVWGEAPPAEASNALQSLVSRLRRALRDTNVIVQSQAGYRLGVSPEDVDAHRFERLAADGGQALRRGEHQLASQLLTDALALWRGPAFADVTGDVLAASAARLDDLRLAATLDRIDAELYLGEPTALVPELEALALEHPLHERLTGQLMRALGESGRQADALQTYERLRARLADELGIDPSAELQQLHLELLRGEIGARAVRSSNGRTSRRTNLKAQLTSFVGRDEDVVRIGKTLGQNRLVTLVGPGGAGKTRLAAEAAARFLDSAPDGVWMVELAQVTTGADVPQAVLGSLGLRESHLLERRGKLSARDAMTRLREGLADAQAVVIFDNCEHVIEAAARLADHLLAECPELRILGTSREPLGIVGEVLLAVPPLGQPAPNAPAVEALTYPAVRLLADRAAAVRPDFEVDDANVAAAIEIVRRLDGLPLAIELAAARLRTLPIDEVAARLDDRFRLLTGGSRTALPRHRTLRAVVEWSWELLSDDEQRLAEQLAVFPSGVTAASASAVCDVADAPDLLASLIDKSLLQPVEGGRRMRMLETIREYGAERLAERGELVQLRRRHAEHFAALLEQAHSHLTSADQLPWFALLRSEHDNVLAAMRYYCDVGEADAALHVAVGLSTHAMMLGNHTEIAGWLSDALAVPGGCDRQLRMIGEALYGLNSAASGRASDADAGLAELRQLAQELVELDLAANPFIGLLCVAVAYFTGDPELAEHFIDDTLQRGNDWARAAVRMFRANLAENTGDVETMRADITAALAEFRNLGERWGLASTLRGVAQLHALDGRLDEAADAYLEALQLQGELHSQEDEGFLFGRLADLELRRGNVERARHWMQRARESAEQHGVAWESVFTLAMLGAIEQQAGRLEEARQLLTEAKRHMSVAPAGHPAHAHLRTFVLAGWARIALADGDFELAQDYARDAVEAALSTRDMPILAAVGVLRAELAAAHGDPAGAAVLLGAAARLRGADDASSPDIAALNAALREVLGEQTLAQHYATGRALDREAALDRLAPHRLAEATTP